MDSPSPQCVGRASEPVQMSMRDERSSGNQSRAERFQLYPGLTAPMLEQAGYARDADAGVMATREGCFDENKERREVCSREDANRTQRGRGVNWIYGRKDPGHTGMGKEGGRERDRDTTPGSGEDRGGAWIGAVTRPDARKHESRMRQGTNEAARTETRTRSRSRSRSRGGREEDEREAWRRIRNQSGLSPPQAAA
ncbi:hypothetical protein M441DRAFT_439782 [Trichoderma asperellum CBS 433.97]|uniref:Uncharacterized protein n=1 Tax=Trichoderma asperellum (strain ATCC 204424 / CBS 433.97 / NBRC 101777) TaxID=1042311 RepID=A0A2T3Z452_TRIA4|nr:hypothetical protein M441DRAFT_439782 [Trichoderma asperellum CBS 433.97]PTB39540.1 hypothetical protein M441DRAFT_439782 [Trichoderma asperellum CBS 433.97]